jgi:UDP-GlcNAc:undecaprenyl-phosphate GlcNAc-1-phosphate transferase
MGIVEGFVIFVLTILGLHLYRRTLLSSPLSQFLRKDSETGLWVANGAGAVLWDIFFGFALYAVWVLHADLKFIIILLASSFLFTIFGWLDDGYDFSPKIKLSAQTGIAFFTVFFWTQNFQISIFCLSVFILVWLVNAVNFLDILDGLAGSVTLLIFLGFAVLFSTPQHSSLMSLCSFWSLALLAFLLQNIHRPRVYLGDAGAHLLGSVLFFLGMEFWRGMPGTKTGMTLVLLFGFLIFDFLFVCFVRFRKKQSLLQKSPDHLALQIFSRTGSKKKTLILFCVFQSIATVAALFFQCFSTSP